MDLFTADLSMVLSKKYSDINIMHVQYIYWL